ncbi:uncharacterized protein LOC141900306 [Tubulanus polymorphus]|uniref:uncharacterized protein LOC141900306 n=1 Tax=Tubulanus polymorphus TaxID=672921 RepID=UPI003DA32AEE
MLRNRNENITFNNCEEFSEQYLQQIDELYRRFKNDPESLHAFLQQQHSSGKVSKKRKKTWIKLFSRKFSSMNLDKKGSAAVAMSSQKVKQTKDVQKRPKNRCLVADAVSDGLVKSKIVVEAKKTKTLKVNDDKNDIDTLETALKRNSEYKEMLYKLLDDTDKQCYKLSEILSSGQMQNLQSFLFSTEEHQDCEYHLKKEHLIMVMGQVNSGKTSLINEILGKGYLPTSELPCTARIVRIKYNKEPYVRLLDNGKLLEEQKLNKKVLHKFIDLEDVERNDLSEVSHVVEVGLDCELLRRGLQIMDSPGLSENDVLNERIEMLSKEDLQLMIYVIDGNRSLNEKDRVFLFNVKAKSPKMRILYVCNKSEENEYASSMDCATDDEEENQVKTKNFIDKGTWTFGNLQKFGLIDKDLTREQCSDYFAVSCHNVRRARRKNQKTKDTDNFNKFVNCVAKNYIKTGNRLLEHAVCRLNLIQKRAFDFCISDRFLNLSRPQRLKENIQSVKTLGLNLMRESVDGMNMRARDLALSMKQMIESKGGDLTEKIIHMTFSPVFIKKEVEKNFLLENCRQQVQDFILVQLNSDVEQLLFDEWKRFVDSILCCIEHLVETFHPYEEYVQDHLKFSFNSLLQFEFEAINLGEVMNFAYLEFAVKTSRNLENVRAALVGWQLTDKWKLQTAKNILNAIDVDKLIQRSHEKMKKSLKACDKEFQNCLNALEQLSNTRCLALPKMQDDLLKLMPIFGLTICKTDALSRIIKQDHLEEMGDFIAQGSRSTIYSCRNNENVIIKKTKNPQDFANVYNFMRFVNHEDLLKPIETSFDSEFGLVLLLPRLRYTPDSLEAYSLFDLLKAGIREFTLNDKVEIFYQLVSIVYAMSEKKFRLTDLRPNNIFIIKHEEGKFKVKVNILKVISLEIPYPDGTLPFHFAPERYDSSMSRAINPYHEVYSLGVLLWMMLKGTFYQPPCLRDANLAQIRSKVTQLAVRDDIVASLDDISGTSRDITQLKTIVVSSVNEPETRIRLDDLYSTVEEYRAHLN